MKPLIVIPARGGSKGIPRKNIKLLGGKPLIQYTIEAAREVFDDSVICVSTDDIEIKDIVESLGLIVPFVRPVEFAQDTTGSYVVLLHAIDFYEMNGYRPDTIILLQPTSPFRTGKHIREALKLYRDDCKMLISVKYAKSNPYYNLFEENPDGFLVKSKAADFTRRQDCPIVYEINGAIYVINVEALKERPLAQFSQIKKYVMDEISSHDLDTLFDWDFAEYFVKK
ncbi:acylneuraminate cytidylyltransferase family protein [Williamwhitmania taraxaci]|uniref:N-acylneuraminate cytidylyltransferase n=1 Tax=Williamwhitmania taraxaci TaxID=1640674 RepID=A0A1G6GGW7_9BACT|nr:acylneuraminate cytidylyltransferase family protein [Williamwhitmania taraxaci]SDB81190.1 N-acylneuraminate cytidylyltransferase [Williamwhitmania taraxaci]